MIYLDHNATTPADPRVVKKMLPYFSEKYGNPSSVHSFGQEARAAIEEARHHIATLMHCHEKEIIFTSGGTEANNLAIRGTLEATKKKGRHLVTSSIEHHAVLNVFKRLEKEGYEVTFLPVNSDGRIEIQTLAEALRPDTVLVSVMTANNESGVMEPIEEIGFLLHERGILFHTDAVQAVGKIPLDCSSLPIDLLSASAHKFGGPKGAGFVYCRKNIRINPQIVGGHHEKGRRAGTENVPCIIGMGKAAEIAHQEINKEVFRIGALRDKLEEGILKSIPEVRIVSKNVLRLYNTSLVLVKYVEGEAMLLNLDFEGIEVSSGSACTSGSLEPSHVLLACGYPHEDAHGSIRFSLGKTNTEEEINTVLEVFPRVVEKLRKMSPFKAQSLT